MSESNLWEHLAACPQIWKRSFKCPWAAKNKTWFCSSYLFYLLYAADCESCGIHLALWVSSQMFLILHLSVNAIKLKSIEHLLTVSSFHVVGRKKKSLENLRLAWFSFQACLEFWVFSPNMFFVFAPFSFFYLPDLPNCRMSNYVFLVMCIPFCDDPLALMQMFVCTCWFVCASVCENAARPQATPQPHPVPWPIPFSILHWRLQRQMKMSLPHQSILLYPPSSLVARFDFALMTQLSCQSMKVHSLSPFGDHIRWALLYQRNQCCVFFL